MKINYALITGASMGLGRAFAYEFAARGFNLILVSLPNQGIKLIADDCHLTTGVDCQTFELDLTDKKALMEFIEEINANYDISVLINNAGMGGSQMFSVVDFKYIENILMLNIYVSTTLIHKLLPNLKRQNDSYILNISSMASLTPTGYKTVYPASKAYIRHLSMGLREEFHGSGVHVSTAILGPMPTQKEIICRIEAQGAIGKMLTMDTAVVAHKCVKALFQKKAEITIGRFNCLVRVLLSFIPDGLVAKLMTNNVRKELK